MIEDRIRLTLQNTDSHGDRLIDRFLFLTIEQLNKSIISSVYTKLDTERESFNDYDTTNEWYNLRLDGHFYTVLDDKIFNEHIGYKLRNRNEKV